MLHLQKYPVSTGLFVLHTVLFVAMAWASQSPWMPTQSVLLEYGARDVVLIARGEWWRLLSAGVIHIGMLHFVVNQMALRFLGPQIETVLGSVPFFFVYTLCVVAGNVVGGLWSFAIGAGASGALFGLLGVGCFLEQSLGQGVRGGFWRMFFVNGALGFVIPGLDHAAHLGGWAVGYLSGALFYLANRYGGFQYDRLLKAVGAGILTVVVALGVSFVQDRKLVSQRLQAAWDQRDPGEEYSSYRILTDWTRLDPLSSETWLHRGIWFLELGYLEDARRDFQKVIDIDGNDTSLKLQQDLWQHQSKKNLTQRIQLLRLQLQWQKTRS